MSPLSYNPFEKLLKAVFSSCQKKKRLELCLKFQILGPKLRISEKAPKLIYVITQKRGRCPNDFCASILEVWRPGGTDLRKSGWETVLCFGWV